MMTLSSMPTSTHHRFFRPLKDFDQHSPYALMLAGSVLAGLPSPAPASGEPPSAISEYEEGQLDLNEHLLTNRDSTFFVRVSGDSMIDAGIHPGDLLVVDRSLRPADGKIVIAVVNGDLTARKLFKKTSKLYLMPQNPRYPSIEIKDDTGFMIWGVVTFVIHAL